MLGNSFIKGRTNVWYFHSTGIGSFLLALHTVERIYFALPSDERGTCYIVSNGDTTLAKKMSRLYPHVQVIRCNRSHILDVLPVLMRSLFQKNFMIYSPSFGEPSILHKLVGFAMRIVRPSKNKMIGFCRPSAHNKIFFSNLFASDSNQTLFESVLQSTNAAIPVNFSRPQLLFSYSVAKRNQTPTIIFHPFPANERRALPPERNRSLIEHLISSYPQYKLIVSGGPENKVAYALLVKGIENPPPFICDLGDFTDQLQILASTTLFIGVDTGATHIASVFGCPVIVLGNRSNPCWLPTYNPKSLILYSLEGCTCEGDKKGDCGIVCGGVKRYACLVNIKQETIYQSIKKILVK